MFPQYKNGPISVTKILLWTVYSWNDTQMAKDTDVLFNWHR